jgi:hypothetical protein
MHGSYANCQSEQLSFVVNTAVQSDEEFIIIMKS